jgi:hypothetical protein
VEQRIDPKIQTEFAVGTDPAYVPGLVAPSPVVTKEPGPEPPEERVSDEAVSDDEEAASGRAEHAERSEGTEPGGPEEQAEEQAEPRTEEAPDGPVFAVSDRRGSITADLDGVRFTLDDQEAEFTWDEIGAVEVRTGRFGRRFTVRVHLSPRRWFDAEVEASARRLLKKWTAELDGVLDAYFEEGCSTSA